MYARASRAYRNIDLASASQEEILDRLYGRLLRDFADAKDAIRKRDIPSKAEALEHADRILTELQLALDFGVAPELCENLAKLYDFVAERMRVANLKLVAEPLDDAAAVVIELRDAFVECRRSAA